MTKIDKVLKELSKLYEFNRKIQTYALNKRGDKSFRKDAAKDSSTPGKEFRGHHT